MFFEMDKRIDDSKNSKHGGGDGDGMSTHSSYIRINRLNSPEIPAR